MGPSRAKKLRTVFKKFLSPAPSAEKIFTLPSCSLPSQYRSLLPARDPRAEELVKLEQSSRKLRNTVLALAATLVIFIVGMVSLVVVTVFQYGTQQVQPPSDLSLTPSLVDHVTKDMKVLSEATGIKSHSYKVVLTGSQCVETCWEFSAFKFKAICERGRCRCLNKNYQRETCLPVYNRCAIQLFRPGQLKMSALQATYRDQVEPVYTCAVKSLPTSAPDKHLGGSTRNNQHDGSNFESVESSQKDSLRKTYKDENMPKEVHKFVPTRREDDATGFSFHRASGDNLSASSDSLAPNVGLSETKSKPTSTNFTPQQLAAVGDHTSQLVLERVSPRSGMQENIQLDPTSPSTAAESNRETESIRESVQLHSTPSFTAAESNLESVHLHFTSPSTAAENSRVHVISVHGDSNWRHAVTNVTVSSSRKQSIIIVLVSYGGRHWNLVVDDNIKVERILLISNHRVSSCTVSFSTRGKKSTDGSRRHTTIPSIAQVSEPASQSKSPEVTRKLLRTGYGDDRRRGSTAQLLESITKIVGDVSSFIGVARADSVIYDADFAVP
ncbi:hypothetical protein ElyMa_001931100 [Elysia marginata]|uniref:Uncharacterized protein n=1 Tax=Elysia marginata TaxID=1093978 RepID=A0AAV4EV57_9GAST|nr:hypothetical protein ElyMa_001931100 [Elysia marginata]